jgi:hypothetical protein
MDFLNKVWDGIRKERVKGYWVLEVIGANILMNIYYLFIVIFITSL